MATYRIEHANCFEWLRNQPRQSIHAVCSDPPFGIVEFLPHELEKLRKGRGGGVAHSAQHGWQPAVAAASVYDPECRRARACALLLSRAGNGAGPLAQSAAHVLLAGTPMLQHLVQLGMSEAGFEVRGAIMRLYRGFRGGD